MNFLKNSTPVTGRTMDQLTICTVSYHSASLLEMNLRLTRELNPAAKFHWVVVDNSDDFQGRSLPDWEVCLIQGAPCLNQGRLKGSYHHAQALNKAMELVSTRYLMVIDPDFFIFRKDWVNQVLAHMTENDLSFWGAPYYPDLTWKRRYFPTVSCMIIDLKKVSSTELDFTPELDEYHTLSGYPNSTLLKLLVGIIPAEVRHIEHQTLAEIARICLRNRWLAEPLSRAFPKRIYPGINSSRDTGFKIQNRFGRKRKYGIETLKPSYINDLFTPKKTFLMSFFARMYQLLVPEDLSLYPKRRSYTTKAKFGDLGFFDVRGEFGWEEYFWKAQPFAMHMKGGTRKYEDIGREMLQSILNQLASTQTTQ